MGVIPLYKPQFLAASTNNIKFHKLMFIRQGGEALHPLGSLRRNYYDAELICVSDEDEKYWIGNYAEGYGFYGIKFNKNDCRDASEEEVKQWIDNPKKFTYEQ